MLLTKDEDFLEAKGISKQQIEAQIERFKIGFPALKIINAATLKNGIKSIEDTEAYIKYFEKHKNLFSFEKFVPASGAATRMFKRLFEFIKEADKGKGVPFENDDFYSISNFFEHIEHFAFFDDLKLFLLNNIDSIDKLIEGKQYSEILKHLLYDKGLGYGSLPKGLLKFHQYDIKSRTALEEHLVEAALYATSNNKVAFLHFTVSPEFIEEFKGHVTQVKEEYETLFDVSFNVSYSIQYPSTDTVAVDNNNSPLRDENGQLLFRPGGHGALIENLNALDKDIIFIKNIDNVVPDRLKEETIKYKKVIAAILIDTQIKIHNYIKQIISNKNIPSKKLDEIKNFVEEELSYIFSSKYELLSNTEKTESILKILNRPIRVCGMVKNEGEPGGGPFMVEDKEGNLSLQIVEKAQIDTKDEQQAAILSSSTHFNPVDIVCGIKNYKGEKFNLNNFIDNDAGIITEKSIKGQQLKAIELPGLWNGGMALWNTIFVEIPLATFNPVKEINDLLREEHQQVLSLKNEYI